MLLCKVIRAGARGYLMKQESEDALSRPSGISFEQWSLFEQPDEEIPCNKALCSGVDDGYPDLGLSPSGRCRSSLCWEGKENSICRLYEPQREAVDAIALTLNKN
jgi:hypothetical protein